mgnify:CR=1 FL=1|jgi:hypothetical protein
MKSRILNIVKRVFNACKNENKEEELRAALQSFTTWHEPETITQEEYEELQKMLEEYADQ